MSWAVVMKMKCNEQKIVRRYLRHGKARVQKRLANSCMHACMTGYGWSARIMFPGLRIDTCANRSIIMSVYQYISYRDLFGLPL